MTFVASSFLVKYIRTVKKYTSSIALMKLKPNPNPSSPPIAATIKYDQKYISIDDAIMNRKNKFLLTNEVIATVSDIIPINVSSHFFIKDVQKCNIAPVKVSAIINTTSSK